MDRPDTKPYQEAMVDTPFSLYCPVVGSPLPNIMWSKNGIVIEKHLEQGFNDHISFGEDGQLLLVSSATVEDSGNYTCYVQNTGGSDSVSYVVAVQGELLQYLNNLLNIIIFLNIRTEFSLKHYLSLFVSDLFSRIYFTSQYSSLCILSFSILRLPF
ncbi:Hemicentin-2 [Portunus trituberculatus]|uniref:Hemicentin-2 n=1 Tax=Portunus trituberculatus TaxID=210409 RepID=A0A5B7KDM3_PORTR|nr:Hemicentin-2 [Portunus trituberculatus]